MSDFITLTCPSCGGKLQITNEMDRFAFGSCGNELIVKRGGGTISLSPVVEGIRAVQTGVDKTASELAIVRLNKEIEDLFEEREWGKPDIQLFLIYLLISVAIGLFFGVIFGNVFTILFFPTLAAGLAIWLYLRKRKAHKMHYEEINKMIISKQKELRWHQTLVKGQNS